MKVQGTAGCLSSVRSICSCKHLLISEKKNYSSTSTGTGWHRHLLVIKGDNISNNRGLLALDTVLWGGQCHCCRAVPKAYDSNLIMRKWDTLRMTTSKEQTKPFGPPRSWRQRKPEELRQNGTETDPTTKRNVQSWTRKDVRVKRSSNQVEQYCTLNVLVFKTIESQASYTRAVTEAHMQMNITGAAGKIF